MKSSQARASAASGKRRIRLARVSGRLGMSNRSRWEQKCFHLIRHGQRRNLSASCFGAAWNRPGGRVVGVLIESDKGEQVGNFLRLELLFEAFGHQRQLADF